MPGARSFWRRAKVVEVPNETSYVVTFSGKPDKYTVPLKHVRNPLKKREPKPVVILDLTLDDSAPEDDAKKHPRKENSRQQLAIRNSSLDNSNFYIDRAGEQYDPTQPFDPYARFDYSRDTQVNDNEPDNEPFDYPENNHEQLYEGRRNGWDRAAESLRRVSEPPPPPVVIREETAEEKAAREKEVMELLENRHPAAFMQEQERMKQVEKKREEVKQRLAMARRMHMTVGKSDKRTWKEVQEKRRKMRAEVEKRNREAKAKREKRRQLAKTQKHRGSRISNAIIDTESDSDVSSYSHSDTENVELVSDDRNTGKRSSPEPDPARARKRRNVREARASTSIYIPVEERIRMARQRVKRTPIIEIESESESDDSNDGDDDTDHDNHIVIDVDTIVGGKIPPESPLAWINSPGRRRSAAPHDYLPSTYKSIAQAEKQFQNQVRPIVNKMKAKRAMQRDAEALARMTENGENRTNYNLRARNQEREDVESEDESEYIDFWKLHRELRLNRAQPKHPYPPDLVKLGSPVSEPEPIVENRGSGRRKQSQPRKNAGVHLVKVLHDVERDVELLGEKLSKSLSISTATKTTTMTTNGFRSGIPRIRHSCTCASEKVECPWIRFQCSSCGDDVHAWCAGLRQQVDRILCVRCAELGKVVPGRVVVPPLISPLLSLRGLRVPKGRREIEAIEAQARIRRARTFQLLNNAQREDMARNVELLFEGTRPKALLPGPCEALYTQLHD